jgi:hypothetical protein
LLEVLMMGPLVSPRDAQTSPMNGGSAKCAPLGILDKTPLGKTIFLMMGRKTTAAILPSFPMVGRVPDLHCTIWKEPFSMFSKLLEGDIFGSGIKYLTRLGILLPRNI